MSLHEQLFGLGYFLNELLRLFPQTVALVHHIFYLLAVLFFIPNYLQCFALDFLYVQVTFLLILECLQLSPQSLNLILLCLNVVVIVDTFELSFCYENSVFQISDFNLLPLHLQPFLSNQFIFLINFSQPKSIIFLLGLVLLQNLIQLLCQLIDLGL